MQRRLAAIMFTDIVGYSAMMQKNEALAARLRARHREVFNRLHKKFNGEIIQYFGDGTLSIFNSTADAAECAVELQRELKQTPQVPIRVGIHTGEISYNEEEVIGDGVNIAARIQSESVPGGIFISGKAQDDIKNNPSLSTKAIGRSVLKNIQRPIDLFAITNPGVTVPEYDWEPVKAFGQAPLATQKIRRRKKKRAATLLAFFFGVFGIHRFYLDQRNFGIAYLAMFILGAFILPGSDQLVAIPAILGFVDFLIFLTTSRANFDEKYNQEFLQQKQHQQEMATQKANDPRNILEKQRQQYLGQAQTAFRNYEFREAIKALIKAIEIKYDDAETHFFLARVYSLSEKGDKALEHLNIAVAFGFQEVDRIRTDGDLAFVRIQPEYLVFEKNNFQLTKELPIAKEDVLDLEETPSSNLLDQLAKLVKERQSGLLSEEEFKVKEQQLKARYVDED